MTLTDMLAIGSNLLLALVSIITCVIMVHDDKLFILKLFGLVRDTYGKHAIEPATTHSPHCGTHERP